MLNWKEIKRSRLNVSTGFQQTSAVSQRLFMHCQQRRERLLIVKREVEPEKCSLCWSSSSSNFLVNSNRSWRAEPNRAIHCCMKPQKTWCALTDKKSLEAHKCRNSHRPLAIVQNISENHPQFRELLSILSTLKGPVLTPHSRADAQNH
jgi:hypothetical protein